MIRLERLIGACATLLAIFGLGVLHREPVPSMAVGALVLLGLHGLASVLLVARPGAHELWRGWLRWLQHAFAFVLVVVLVGSTGGAASSFFPFLLFPVLAAALRWGGRATLWTAVAMLAVFVAFIVAALLAPPPGLVVDNLVVRLLSLAAAAVLLGYVASALLFVRGEIGEEEASLAMILEGVADGVLLVDDLGVVHMANGVAERMFSAGFRELLGMDIRRLLPDVEVALAALPATQEGGGPQRFPRELPAVRLDGTEFPVEFTVGCLRIGERPTFFGVVRDVSRRKQAEAEARLRREMELVEEERLRLVQELHDGVLQTLTGAALQLRTVQTLMDRDPERAGRRLTQVREALAAEQRELRFWASDTKHMLGHKDDGVGLEERLHSTLDRIRSTWGIEIELAFSLTEELPPVFRQQVYRVVQEAVVNAARHSRASLVRVEVREQGTAVAIEVRDDGAGFAFRGRFDAEELAERRLGPVLLKHRVAAVNGTLAIESTPEGARLNMLIPRALRAE